ncbi:MAG: hypothetical protein ACI934_001036 [Pseudohongiellaceae bacterium]|jgi:hypothetical protein
MNKVVFGIFVLLLQLPAFLLAAESTIQDWELKRDREGIQVYTRKVPGSPYAAVKTITVVSDLRLSSMVALILDSEACAQWADKCAESSVYEKISDTELLIYTVNDLPFPVKDRDILARVHWSQNPMTLDVTMTSEAVTGIVEEQKGRLRLTEATISWHLQPLAMGAVQVINEAHVNPGSPLPGGLINMLLVDSPFETMKSFRKAAALPKYEQASISFVQEPL